MRRFIFWLTIGVNVWAADPPSVSGTWVFEPGHAAKSKIAALAIRQSADNIQISEMTGAVGKGKKVDLTCMLGGDQCKIKDADEYVSFWYNGPALVMMEMRHGKTVVTKTRLEPSADGKTLHVEVTHISPSGKSETFELTRQSGS